MKKTRKLRWHLTMTLSLFFALLWLCVCFLSTRSAEKELDRKTGEAYRQAYSEAEYNWDYYKKNIEQGMGADAQVLMTYHLSTQSGALYGVDGGMAMAAVDKENDIVMRSQLSFGYGHEEGVDLGQRWHFEFDSGLDDEGQMAFARWMMAHRDQAWAYVIYPPERADWADGSFARVTGAVKPGHLLAVEKIELVHPDGSTELMVETSNHSEDPVTMDFRYLRLGNALMPSWSSVGDGYTDMKRHLGNFRKAQSMLDEQLEGDKEFGAELQVTRVWDSTPAAIRQQRPFYAASFVAAVLILLALGKLLSNTVTTPVEQLCREAESGQCRTDGPVKELNTLAASFNSAQARLTAQLEREREFTRAAAHELKTPLAVLRTHVEALQEDILPEKRAHYMAVTLEETDRMAQMVNSLLTLSRLENGTALHTEAVDLSAVIREVFEPLELPMERKRMDLTMDLEDGWLEGDKSRLKEAVGNLATNALRYGAEGGTISAALCRDEEKEVLRLTVENDGPAIPEECLEHLFEPFYRVDKSHSRELGGTGLGLAIVKAAAEAHGGTCSVENRVGGVRFQIELPLK